jgi:transposase
MALHLQEVSLAVAPSHHAVLMLDQAGWHLSPKLKVPDNITLLPLPSKSPELNPVETIWQYMRDNWLSNRVFTSYPDILDHCCAAWNKLTDQPWRIMSIGLRDWAHRFQSAGLGIIHARVRSTIQRFGSTTKRWRSQRRTLCKSQVPVRATAASILRP